MAGSMDFRLNLLANTTGLQQGMNGAKFAVNALVAAMAAAGVGLSVQGLAQAADSYTNLSARINIATKDGGNFNQAMAGVHQVALATNSNLTTTADLFTRLNAVGRDMGMTQQQALDLTKTVTQAIKIGGGTAEAADGAVTQFIQAMQGGVLRGEEFNSIMEGGYGLAEALAKGLGVTTGELRKMAEAGELSSERVVKAIGSQATSVQATYDQFPTTIGNALQRISTSWETLIGKMDQANGASATVAQWLVMLADNMQTLDFLLEDAGNGFVWVGDQLKKIDPATIEALKTALMSAYDALKSLGSTVGVTFEAAVGVINTVLSQLFSFGSGVDTAQDKTSGFTKTLQVINIALGVLNDGFAAIGIGTNLFVGALYSVASAWANLVSKFTWGDVKQEAIANMRAMKAEADKYYKEASDGALNFKSKAVEAIEDVDKTQKQIDLEAVASSKAKLDQLLADQKSEVVGKKRSEEEKLSAVQAYAEAAIAANGGVMNAKIQAELIEKGYMVTLDQLGKVTVTSLNEAKKATEEKAKATELAKEREKKAEEDYQNLVTANIPKRIALEQQIVDAKKTGDLTALLSAQTSLAAINAKEAELNEARKARSAEVASGIQGSTDKARKAATALGLDLDVSLNRISEGFKTNATNVNNLALGVENLGAKGKQAGEVTYEAWLKWLETAKSQAEIDFAKQKLNEFGEQGKLSASQVEQGLIAVKLQAQELPDAIDPVTEAFKRLGIETKENLKLAAEQAKMDYITIRESGQATAEGIQKAYEKAAQAAATSGDAGVIASTNAVGAGRNLEIQIDDTGRAFVASANSMEESMHRVNNATYGAQQSFRNLGAIAREEALSSTEAWNNVLKAQEGGNHATPKGSKTRLAFNQDDVIAELIAMGYSEDNAKAVAKGILDGSKSGGGYKNASASWLAKNGFDVVGSFIGGGGGTSNANYVREALEKYSQYKGNTAVTTGPASTRRLELVNGAQTAVLSGSSSDVDAIEAMLSEFEMLKKST